MLCFSNTFSKSFYWKTFIHDMDLVELLKRDKHLKQWAWCGCVTRSKTTRSPHILPLRPHLQDNLERICVRSLSTQHWGPSRFHPGSFPIFSVNHLTWLCHLFSQLERGETHHIIKWWLRITNNSEELSLEVSNNFGSGSLKVCWAAILILELIMEPCGKCILLQEHLIKHYYRSQHDHLSVCELHAVSSFRKQHSFYSRSFLQCKLIRYCNAEFV